MKHRLSKKVAVAMAAAFLLAPATTGVVELHSQQLPVVQAAKGDHGVDWSKYQGANGVWGYPDDKFAIAQIGGTTDGYNCYDQWTYSTQVSGAIAQGKRAHTYIWWQNVTTNWQADQVLNYFLPKVQTPKDSIVALDVESGNQNTQAIQHACDRIRQAGYTPMVYGYKNYLQSHVDLSYLSNNEQLWLAEYPDYSVRRYPNFGYFPSYNNVGIFQFTSTYISGGLDGDIDLTGITDNGYKNGNSQKPKSNTPAVQQGKQIHQATHNYIVRPGDSWWGIATKYGLDMNTLAQMNGTTINTTIYPGQVIRVGYAKHVNPIMNNDHAEQSSWTDALGDTWHKENGTFTSNTWLHLRWGARPSSSSIAIIGPGTVIKYDAYSRHGGYVWLRQPREYGQYGYIACRDANTNEPYGEFE